MSLKKIGLFALTMLIAGSIDSVRNLPSTAFFGPSLISFYILGAIFFLLPGAIVSADLASAFPEQSGVYRWSKLAFGKKTAFLTVWLQWVNTLVWFPTILAFIAGTASFLINPVLGTNHVFLLSVIIGLFWLLTFLNLRGVEVSAKFASICTLFGMIIPMSLIIILTFVWLGLGKPLHIEFSWPALLPSFHSMDNWFSLTAVVTSCLGIELAAVHMTNIQNARKNFPKAILFATVFMLTTMIVGSLAIAMVIPQSQIVLNEGVLAAFSVFLQEFHLSWLFRILVVMIVIGSIGQMVNWMISPARGLGQAAMDGFMPHKMLKVNRHGVSKHIGIIQAIVATIMSMAFLLMPSVNGSYWLLTALSTELYVLMYVMMFLTALRLEWKMPKRQRLMGVLHNRIFACAVPIFGLVGSFVTLYIGFLPPTGIDVGSAHHYDLVFTSGLLLMIVPIIFFYAYRYFKERK